MDEQRFDQLSRRLAGMRTRRQAIKAIAGAVVASVAGVRAAEAQSCTAHYSPCSGDAQCCAGAVCEYGLCMPGCRIDGAFTSAWMSPPGDICRQCLPEISTSTWSPANEGMSCWSGDPGAGATFCQRGECRASGPASCPPPPACFTDELIDPATCTYLPAPAGTVCGGKEMCYGEFYTPADTCDGNGFCIGGGSQTTACFPYVCGDGACTTSCARDGDCASGSACCDGRCVVLGTIEHCAGCNDTCDVPDACSPASCSLGVCATVTACEPVDACTPAFCDNGVCNARSACGDGEVCEGGQCVDSCLELLAMCDSADQCCDGAACSPVGKLSVDQCCLDLGASGCSDDRQVCCMAPHAPGSGIPVFCGNGVCGGAGALCPYGSAASACASGVCCGSGSSARCCGAGEECDGTACVPAAP